MKPSGRPSSPMKSRRQAATNKSSPSPRLTNAKLWIRRRFETLGLVLATNQIAALLLCCVLICSLLSPAIIMSFSSYGSRAPDNDRGLLPWELGAVRKQGLLASADDVCWDKLAVYWSNRRARVIRVQPLLISSGSRSSVLRKPVLHELMRVQGEITRRLEDGQVTNLTCTSDGTGRCLVSSPLSAWRDEANLLGDEDIHATLSRLPPSSSGPAVPAPLTVSLTGERRDRHGIVKDAKYLTVNFYVEDTFDTNVFAGSKTRIERDARLQSNEAWYKAVIDVFDGKGWPSPVDSLGRVQSSRMPGKRVILKYLPNLPQRQSSTTLENTIYLLAYITVGFYVYFTLRRLQRVHSKVGLVMTGLIEIFLTGAMSLSICWLLGQGLDLVPWKLIPFLVVVCGVDNLFAFTNAVCETDISLSVPERIAEGLSVVGLSSAMTLLLEICGAALVHQIVTIQVFRELVVFTAVALIVDYCLELVFFTVILSIDIQRLELADLLQQGSSILLPSGKPKAKPDITDSDSQDSFNLTLAGRYIVDSIKAHKARTITFTILAVINIVLFLNYGSEHFLPAFCSEPALSGERSILGPSLPVDFVGSMSKRGASRILADLPVREGAARDLWQALNPKNLSSVQVYVEAPLYATFYDTDRAAPESAEIAQVDTPRSQIALLAVLATALTTTALYFVLRYLLKDAELLTMRRAASQKHRDRREKALKANVAMELVRDLAPHDVELIASSGTLLASWSLLSDFVSLWKRNDDHIERLGRLGIPITADPPSLVSLQLSSDGAFCAALTRKGRVLTWSIDQTLLLDFSIRPDANIAVVGRPLRLLSTTIRLPSSPMNAPPSLLTGDSAKEFVTIHDTGAIVSWDCSTCIASRIRDGQAPQGFYSASNLRLSTDSSKVEPAAVLLPQSDDKFSLASMRLPPRGDGELVSLELLEDRDGISCSCQARLPRFSDDATQSSTCRGLILGHKTGKITLSLFANEGAPNVQTRAIAELDSPVRRISASRTERAKCSACLQAVPAGLIIVAATSDAISALHVSYEQTGSQQCRCSYSASSRRSTDVASGSAVRRSGKRAPRLSHASEGLVPPYPLASHTGRRPSSGGPISTDTTVDDDATFLSPAHATSSANGTTDKAQLSPTLRVDGKQPNASIDGQLVVRELYQGPCDPRGGWALLQDAIVGVRRRTTLDLERDVSSPFARWEAWSIPLAKLVAGVQTEPGSAPLDMDAAVSATSSDGLKHPLSAALRKRRSSSALLGRRAAQATSSSKVLPFTRAGKVVGVFDRQALAASFGDTLVIISSHA